jgi:hypothetical protein
VAGEVDEVAGLLDELAAAQRPPPPPRRRRQAGVELAQ